jgi:hypothetical protein
MRGLGGSSKMTQRQRGNSTFTLYSAGVWSSKPMACDCVEDAEPQSKANAGV